METPSMEASPVCHYASGTEGPKTGPINPDVATYIGIVRNQGEIGPLTGSGYLSPLPSSHHWTEDCQQVLTFISNTPSEKLSPQFGIYLNTTSAKQTRKLGFKTQKSWKIFIFLGPGHDKSHPAETCSYHPSAMRQMWHTTLCQNNSSSLYRSIYSDYSSSVEGSRQKTIISTPIIKRLRTSWKHWLLQRLKLKLYNPSWQVTNL